MSRTHLKPVADCAQEVVYKGPLEHIHIHDAALNLHLHRRRASGG